MRNIQILNTCKKILVALPLSLIVSIAVATPPSSGLVLKFVNGPSAVKIKDSSGHKNNGTPEFIAVQNSPSLVSMQDTHQLTLAIWIKPKSIGAQFPVLISKGGNEQPGAYGGYELVLNATGDNDILFESGGFMAFTSGANGSLVNNHLGEWIHIVFTIDTVAQTAQFYVNGQPVAGTASSENFSDVNFNLPNNLYIGVPDPAANGNRASFDGEMRQIMIFNQALSLDAIQKIFNTTKPGNSLGIK